MSDVGGTNSKRARGMTLIEVMVAIVLLVLIFIFVGQNMVASSWATSKASQRSMDISAANYFMGVMYGDGSLWGTYPDSPKDPCGNIADSRHRPRPDERRRVAYPARLQSRTRRGRPGPISMAADRSCRG